MSASIGRPSAVAQAAAEQKARAVAAADQVTVALAPPPVPVPPGQRVIHGYRLVRTFSDVSRRPHRIFRAGEVLDSKREVERLARLGAELVAVEKPEPKPAE